MCQIIIYSILYVKKKVDNGLKYKIIVCIVPVRINK